MNVQGLLSGEVQVCNVSVLAVSKSTCTNYLQPVNWNFDSSCISKQGIGHTLILHCVVGFRLSASDHTNYNQWIKHRIYKTNFMHFRRQHIYTFFKLTWKGYIRIHNQQGTWKVQNHIGKKGDIHTSYLSQHQDSWTHNDKRNEDYIKYT